MCVSVKSFLSVLKATVIISSDGMLLVVLLSFAVDSINIFLDVNISSIIDITIDISLVTVEIGSRIIDVIYNVSPQSVAMFHRSGYVVIFVSVSRRMSLSMTFVIFIDTYLACVTISFKPIYQCYYDKH